ncbi:MAG: hypothetical protein GY754_30625 [bacterium]|nr:hypothetical protein [bacterium]
MIRNCMIVAAVALVMLTGCSKAPGEIKTIGGSVEFFTENEKEVWVLKIYATIENENPETAFLDFAGTLDITDSGKKIVSVPFTLPIVFPLNTDKFVDTQEIKKRYTKEEIEPVLAHFKVDTERLMAGSEKGTEDDPKKQRIAVDNEAVKFREISYKKENILTLLKEKVNEKK